MGILTINLFDTAKVFSFIQRIPPLARIQKEQLLQTPKHVNYLSLEKIAKAVLDVEMDKFFQVADWRIRPLPTGMLDYARSDSHYLIPVYLVFMKLLNPACFPSPSMAGTDSITTLPHDSAIFNGQLYLSAAMLHENMQAAGNDWVRHVQEIFEYNSSLKGAEDQICQRLISLAAQQSL